jgi:nitrite reductase/ring-hydroxylating ferredoxin subunit
VRARHGPPALDVTCETGPGPTSGRAIANRAANGAALAVVVLRRGDHAWAYRNLCPHFSIPLNYEPRTFWTYEAKLVMCAHHSAMFRFEDGVCVDGPCEGAALTPVAIRIERRRILVDNDAGRADTQSAPQVLMDLRHNTGDK